LRLCFWAAVMLFTCMTTLAKLSRYKWMQGCWCFCYDSFGDDSFCDDSNRWCCAHYLLKGGSSFMHRILINSNHAACWTTDTLGQTGTQSNDTTMPKPIKDFISIRGMTIIACQYMAHQPDCMIATSMEHQKKRHKSRRHRRKVRARDKAHNLCFCC